MTQTTTSMLSVAGYGFANRGAGKQHAWAAGVLMQLSYLFSLLFAESGQPFAVTGV